MPKCLRRRTFAPVGAPVMPKRSMPPANRRLPREGKPTCRWQRSRPFRKAHVPALRVRLYGLISQREGAKREMIDRRLKDQEVITEVVLGQYAENMSNRLRAMLEAYNK